MKKINSKLQLKNTQNVKVKDLLDNYMIAANNIETIKSNIEILKASDKSEDYDYSGIPDSHSMSNETYIASKGNHNKS